MYVFTVDCCCPGNMVTITAVVKATGSDTGHGGRSSKDHCTFHLYLHAISISNDKLMAGGEPSTSSPHVEFSTKVNHDFTTVQAKVIKLKCKELVSHFSLLFVCITGRFD